MDEISEITDYVVSASSRDTTLIWGMGSDESLEEKISVTIIATGFKMNSIPELYVGKKQKHFVPLRDSESTRSGREERSKKNAHQRSLEFDVKEGENVEEYILMEQSKDMTPEEKEKKMAERLKQLKETHEKLKDMGYLSASGDDEIEELENVPAYVRKKIQIDHEKHSEDKEVSRFRLTDEEDGEEGPKLKSDNSYLHDNVD
jgi:cell division protein FtsZ